MVKSNLYNQSLIQKSRNNKIMIIQNMAYDQQIQKQETEKSNIVNSKTKLTNGRLELIQKPDPFSDYTITSVRRT